MQQSHFNKISSRQAEIKRAILEGLQEQDDGYAPMRHAILSPRGPDAASPLAYPNDRRHRGYRRQPHDQRALRERLYPYEAIDNPHEPIGPQSVELPGTHPLATVRRGPGLLEPIDNHARRFSAKP
jgi:hypothetical protein